MPDLYQDNSDLIILLFPTNNKIFVCIAKSQNNTEEGSENNTGIEEISTLPMCLA